MTQKQKSNTKSSTAAELVGTDDATKMMLWTNLVMEDQGYKIDENILYQDNIVGEEWKGKSVGKQSCALNVQYISF